MSFAVIDWMSSAWATLVIASARDDRHDGEYQVLTHASFFLLGCVGSTLAAWDCGAGSCPGSTSG